MREESFTRAAEALYLTQPAVTRQIAVLEAEMKTRLLDRLGKRVQMTPAGEALYRYAQEILRLSEEAIQSVDDVRGARAGKIRVGASITVATYLLPEQLRRYRETFPGVELRVHTGVSSHIVDMVTQGLVDVGIVMGVEGGIEHTVYFLRSFPSVVVVPPDHPLASRKEGIRREELAGIPLILMEEGMHLRTLVDRLLSEAGVEEHVSLELDNVESIKRMVRAGLGVTLLPLMTVAEEVSDKRLMALPLTDVPSANRRLALIHRKDKYVSLALREFLEQFQREFSEQES
ncbi:MAG: LysR family transcriptional regulator [Chthonomonadaceae bacterium]|nr:LysR family transcriptional regulator [Chthonomonadaceae bacterium]